jgi:hypothetical protein
MARVRPFDEYVALLGRLTSHVDPTAASANAAEIKQAAESLADLDEVNIETLTQWIREHPEWVPALGLTVGLSQEKLRNSLKHRFDSAGWIGLGKARPAELATMLEEEFDLVRLLRLQRHRAYDFGDILVARVNTVLPSVIDTPANRSWMPSALVSKAVPPAAIAKVIAFLCSPDAWPINGAAIPVYGDA